MNPMSETPQSLEDLLRAAAESTVPGERFGNQSARTLRVDLDGGVWLKPGVAIAYRGDIRFERLATICAPSVVDAVLRETAPLIRATGRGRLYCGHHGAHSRVVRLAGESIVVAWTDLLAFEETLTFASHLVGGGVGIAAGGLTAVTLSGHGAFALLTHGQPLAVRVTPGQPVSTDPHATLAWSADLAPTLKIDVSWRSAFGHGGQEAVQMLFEGSGFVLVQPCEDPARFALGAHPLRSLASLIEP
ncbi:MAG: AIM24 family protein [Vicinamibacterales bacterium]